VSSRPSDQQQKQKTDEQFFSSAVEIFFGQRWLSPLPLEKLARTPAVCRLLYRLLPHGGGIIIVIILLKHYISRTANIIIK